MRNPHIKKNRFQESGSLNHTLLTTAQWMKHPENGNQNSTLEEYLKKAQHKLNEHNKIEESKFKQKFNHNAVLVADSSCHIISSDSVFGWTGDRIFGNSDNKHHNVNVDDKQENIKNSWIKHSGVSQTAQKRIRAQSAIPTRQRNTSKYQIQHQQWLIGKNEAVVDKKQQKVDLINSTSEQEFLNRNYNEAQANANKKLSPTRKEIKIVKNLGLEQKSRIGSQVKITSANNRFVNEEEYMRKKLKSKPKDFPFKKVKRGIEIEDSNVDLEEKKKEQEKLGPLNYIDDVSESSVISYTGLITDKKINKTIDDGKGYRPVVKSINIDLFLENPLQTRRFIDKQLPGDLKMVPSSWVPGYRSIVERRREQGLSGAGITEGVDKINTVRAVREPLKHLQVSNTKNKENNSVDDKNDLGNRAGSKDSFRYQITKGSRPSTAGYSTRVAKYKDYGEYKAPVVRTSSEYQALKQAMKEEKQKIEDGVIAKQQVWCSKTNSLKILSVPFTTNIKGGVKKGLEINGVLLKKNMPQERQTLDNSLFLHSNTKYRPSSSHRFRSVERERWVGVNDFSNF